MDSVNEHIKENEVDGSSLIAWMQTFSNQTLFNINDGYQIAQILQIIIPKMKLDELIEDPKCSLQRFVNWNIILTNLLGFYQENLQLIILMKLPNLYSLSNNLCNEEIELLMLLILSCAVQGEQRAYFIDCIKQLDIQHQLNIMQKIQTLVLDKEKIINEDDWFKMCNRENTNINDIEKKNYFKCVKNLSEERKDIFLTCRHLITEHLRNEEMNLSILKSPIKEQNLNDQKIKQMQESMNIKCEELDDLLIKLDNLKIENIKLKSQNVDLLKEATTMKLYRDELDNCREQLLHLGRVEKENIQLKSELKEQASNSCDNIDILNSTCYEHHLTSLIPDQRLPSSVINYKDLQRHNWQLEQQLELSQKEVMLLQQKIKELSFENAQFELRLSTQYECLCYDNGNRNNSNFTDPSSYISDVLLDSNTYRKDVNLLNNQHFTTDFELVKNDNRSMYNIEKSCKPDCLPQFNHFADKRILNEKVNIDDIKLETVSQGVKLKDEEKFLDESFGSDKLRCSDLSSSSFAHHNDFLLTPFTNHDAYTVNNCSPINSINSEVNINISNKCIENIMPNDDYSKDDSFQKDVQIDFEGFLLDSNSNDELINIKKAIFNTSSKKVDDLRKNSNNIRELLLYKDVIAPQLVFKIKQLRQENQDLKKLLTLTEQKFNKSTISNHHLLSQYQALCWIQKRVEDEEGEMKKKLTEAMDKNHQLLSQLISCKDQCSEEQKNHIKEMSELRLSTIRLKEEMDKKRKNSKRRNWILNGFIKKKNNLLKDKCHNGLFLNECVTLSQFLEESNQCFLPSIQNDDCLMKENSSNDNSTLSKLNSSDISLGGSNKTSNKNETRLGNKMVYSKDTKVNHRDVRMNESVTKYLYPFPDNQLDPDDTINGQHCKTGSNISNRRHSNNIDIKTNQTEAKEYHFNENINSRKENLNDSAFSRSFSLRNYTISDKKKTADEIIKKNKEILNNIHIDDQITRNYKDCLDKNNDSAIEKTLTELSAACWNLNSKTAKSNFCKNIDTNDNEFKNKKIVENLSNILKTRNSSLKNDKTLFEVEIKENNKLDNMQKVENNEHKILSNNKVEFSALEPVVILDSNKNNISAEERLSLLLKDPVVELKNRVQKTPPKIYNLPITVCQSTEQKLVNPMHAFIQRTIFSSKLTSQNHSDH